MFEEINHDLSLVFRYEWSTSHKYGFLRNCFLLNTGSDPQQLTLLDGLQNIMPAGVPSDLQNNTSNLVNAYKRCELDQNSGLGIFSLSAVIIDRAEPSEALKANSVWSAGLENPTYLLSTLQLDDFRNGREIRPEHDIKGERGAYFISGDVTLLPGKSASWSLIADVNKSQADIASLIQNISEKGDSLLQEVEMDRDWGTHNLAGLIASADGMQLSSDAKLNARHISNTLFNVMRGGIFDDGYNIAKWDIENFIKSANRDVYQKHQDIIHKLPDRLRLEELFAAADATGDPDLIRITREYLPLKFSRRHGDPSRPWNRFSINTVSEKDGSKVLDYEGNWRDIFQNWEALAHAYPGYIQSMITKFLNATTLDGYNPYRVMKHGFDWEVIDEHDPWAYIGYWGDHQIIYLQKFLEFIKDHFPDRMQKIMGESWFVFANVPYKIKAYREICQNPKDTIIFDTAEDLKIRALRDKIGADGAIRMADSTPVCAGFIEKLLITALTKLSNFVPEGGIWMNTQRPEWNDANNALVGNGVSMVTLYYLRRFFSFFIDILPSDGEVDVAAPLHSFYAGIKNALTSHHDLLSDAIDDTYRKSIMDMLGEAGSEYRQQVYAGKWSHEGQKLPCDELRDFGALVLQYLDHSIKANKRKDGLYHAYNLLSLSKDKAAITYLDEMLEGQVGVLSSGYLEPEESVSVLDALKQSRLFREDQYSYILYPDKTLPGFMEKNRVSADKIEQSSLLKHLVSIGDNSILQKSPYGHYHFHPDFRNADVLKQALENLSPEFSTLVENEKGKVMELYEQVFNHKAFTGRSGTFFAYEGLGSIYWHMVSKLLLATNECIRQAIDSNSSPEISGRLMEHYYEIQAGIGTHKSPELYGAFSTDPYSHTPKGKGVQQPGMTGQVKEDIISRLFELGVQVQQGKLIFAPELLQKDEFLKEPAVFEFYDVHLEVKEIRLDTGSLAFTYCQVPVIYHLGDRNTIKIKIKDGSSEEIDTNTLNENHSHEIFMRTGKIERIDVGIDQTRLK